jgi:predicted membrane GTPase involved in stress response
MVGSAENKFMVFGRESVLHLSVLIETMRREGCELQIGQPPGYYKRMGDQKNVISIER